MSALRTAIVTKLQNTSGVTSLATGGIYPNLPPEGAPSYPFVVVMAQQAPRAERVFQRVACEDAIYLVKVIDQNTSPKRAGQVLAAIRTALDLASLTVTGYAAMGINWVMDVDYAEQVDGVIYQHNGGFYRIMASAS